MRHGISALATIQGLANPSPEFKDYKDYYDYARRMATLPEPGLGSSSIAQDRTITGEEAQAIQAVLRAAAAKKPEDGFWPLEVHQAVLAAAAIIRTSPPRQIS